MTNAFTVTKETTLNDLQQAYRQAVIEVAENMFESTVTVPDNTEAKPLRIRKANSGLYFITGFSNKNTGPEMVEFYQTIRSGALEDFIGDNGYTSLVFQHGNKPEEGRNGITAEALILVLTDRLESFQKTTFACDENQEAIEHLNAALAALERRAARLKEE